jgi:LAO/AO transport system kinase
MVAEVLTRIAAGDVRALARALSVVEDGGARAAELVAGARAAGSKARRIGITGAPGAGKSTLTDQMVRFLRAKGERVGVVAVDPTSPYTGGALLGDRIRMQGFTGDTGVFIRSMASRGAMGGVAAGVDGICTVLAAAGFGTLIVETVGVGQDEVSVGGVVDVTALVLVPGMGDDVQSLKAGVMESADVFVVNKADLDGVDRVVAEVQAMQSLASEHGSWIPPVIRTCATTGEGIEQLLRALDEAVVALPIRRLTSTAATLKLDHLGIAVRSIAGARGFYEGLGLRVASEETVAHEGVRVAMLGLGESRIELLEATSDESVIGRFVAKRGEGLHHIAIKVDRIDQRFSEMRAAGVRLVNDEVKVGAGGHRYFFVHPASTGGVLVELVGE